MRGEKDADSRDSASDDFSEGRNSSIRPFGRSLPMQLMRVRELVMQRFRPNLNAHGLTDQQWRIIRALAEAEALEILEVSNRCCIHPASLSRILPKLEAEGYLSRRTNKEDQRRVIVSLTGAGRRFFESVSPESETIYQGLEKEIGSELLARLYRELDAVAAALANGADRPSRNREKAG